MYTRPHTHTHTQHDLNSLTLAVYIWEHDHPISWEKKQQQRQNAETLQREGCRKFSPVHRMLSYFKLKIPFLKARISLTKKK